MAVLRKPIITARKQKIMRTRKFTKDVFTDLFNVLVNTFGNPLPLLAIIASVALITSHKVFAEGALGKALDGSKNSIAKWIVANSDKFLGMSVFLPAVVSIQERFRMYIAGTIVAWVYLTPTESLVGYAVMSSCLVAYFRSTMLTTRLFVLVSLTVLMSLEFFNVKF